MVNLKLPSFLEDKTYQIKFHDQSKTLSKIITYFPLSDNEKQIFVNVLQNDLSFNGFYPIFSDKISEHEWNKSKEQIKKKFQDELFDID